MIHFKYTVKTYTKTNVKIVPESKFKEMWRFQKT
jgi:hypothetical protein